MINKELKRAILNCLLDNENTFCRCVHCMQEFRSYIFDADGKFFLIGGEDVLNFIEQADALIYPRGL